MSADTFGRIALEVPALAVALVVCLGFFTYLFKWMVSQLLDKQGQQMQRQTDAFDRQTLISQRQADGREAGAVLSGEPGGSPLTGWRVSRNILVRLLTYLRHDYDPHPAYIGCYGRAREIEQDAVGADLLRADDDARSGRH